jgi:uncharacterized phage-associated protein
METTNSSKKCRYVADKLIRLFINENETLSHKKLQKLMYLTYGFYYYVNDELLFEEKFEAWPHGPVCRELYFDIKKITKNNYNAFNIKDIKLVTTNESYKDEKQINYICDYVKKYFGDWSANALENLTHESEGAWKKVVNKEDEEADELYLKDCDIKNEMHHIIELLK